MTERESKGVARVLERVRSFGLRCLDCFEQLTLAERLQERAYCADCFPDEMDEEIDDGIKPC